MIKLLRQQRLKLGYSMEKTAKLLRFKSFMNYYYIEHGYSIPKLEVRSKLCKVLRIKPSKLQRIINKLAIDRANKNDRLDKVNNALGYALYKYRTKHKLTVVDMSNKLGYTNSVNISHIERGLMKPKGKHLKLLNKLLGAHYE